MRRWAVVGLLFLTFAVQLAFAGQPWGRANYTINATLIDSTHTIEANQTVTYINKSPDTLTELHWTLFPNSANGTETHLWRESKRIRMRAIFFANESSYGSMEVENLTLDGKKLALEIDLENPDLALLHLPQPLLPGDSVTLNMDFSVRVPNAGLMRFERRGSTYNVSQWYPKLAVYDERGWNPYTYLEMGEFYAEFGDYDVTLTLPETYIVAATGTLADSSESARMAELAALGEQIYGAGEDKQIKKAATAYADSLAELKLEGQRTVRFAAKDVVDFAWFASKRFVVRLSTVTLPESGRQVQCETYVLPENIGVYRDAQEWLESVTEYMSRNYGEYPHPKVAVVDQGPSDGGMEYPMITLVGSFPSRGMEEMVVVHEVAHNWFFGTVANDQRRWPWLDEAVTNYVTSRYMMDMYPEGRNVFGGVLDSLGFFIDVNGMSNFFLQLSNEMGYVVPTTMRAEDYPNLMTYSGMVYDRGSNSLLYLREYIGHETFDGAMKVYAERYWMSHPTDKEFIASLEQSTGMDLGWFFAGYLDKAVLPEFELDVESIKPVGEGWSVAFEVEEKNGTTLPAQVRFSGEGQSEDIWVPTGQYDVEQSVLLSFKPEQIAVDPYQFTGDADYRDNYAKRPFDLTAPMHLPRGDRRDIYVSPYMAYQFTEGLILGGSLGNTMLFPGHPEIDITGGYGFVSGDGNVRGKLSDQFLFSSRKMRGAYELRGQDWAGYRQLKVNGKLKFFPLFNESYHAHTLEATGYLNHIVDGSKFDRTLWTAGKHSNARLHYGLLHRKLFTRFEFDAVFVQSLEVNGGQDDYQKLDLSGKIIRRLSRKHYMILRGFHGEILNDTMMPRQERYYASGGVDPNYETSYLPDRTGATWFSHSRNLISSGGTLVRGYTGMVADKAVSTASFEVRDDSGGLFFDSGRFDNTGVNGEWVASAGLTFGNELFRLHLPLWISDPLQGSEWISMNNMRDRVYLSFTLSSLSLGFTP